MAAANCSTVALLQNIRPKTAAISSSSSSTSFSLCFGRRRNHLRPKILKALTKPYPTPSIPIPPPPLSLEPLEQVEFPDSVGEEVRTADVEVRVQEDVETEGVQCCDDELRSEIGTGGSEMVVVDRFAVKLDTNVLGMYGLGLFVLQAVCAVFIFGSAVKGSRDGEDEEFESGRSENVEKKRVALEDDVRISRIVAEASEVVNVDESVLEERIAEIMAMARNARQREARVGHGKSSLCCSLFTKNSAIMMRQGTGSVGLYTVKAFEKEDEAYKVAFEDRGDADNFCYILESFFEDTEDFTADIVPLPTKEMRAPVELGVLNVIIVKKGQLKLYAGQPLSEVETRLRALVL